MIFYHYKIYKHLIAIGLIALTSFVLFAPILIFDKPLTWDAANYFLPMRFVIADTLHHGGLPFWNPYTRFGFPLHADPQSGAAYMPAIIIAFLFGYNYNILAWEFYFHICAAGFGFYFLSYHLLRSRTISFLLAVCYLSSGFFIGNAQHISWVIAGAWIPFVFVFYLRLIEESKLENILALSLFSYLLLCGGYPAFSIVVGYGLLFHYIFYLIPNLWIKTKKNLIRITGTLLLSFIITLLLSAFMWYSFIEAYSHLDRTGKMKSIFNEGSFTIHSFISFISPGAVISSISRLNTDLSMANVYFGLFPLLLLPLVLVVRSFKAKLLLLTGIFFLCISLGDQMPFRSFLFNYFPLMNTFRFPAMFRLFAIVSFLLSAGFILNELFISGFGIMKNYFFYLAAICFVIIVGIIFKNGLPVLPSFIHADQWIDYFGSINWQSVLLWQLTVQFIFLICFILFLTYFNKRSYIILLSFVLLQVINTIFFSMFNIRITVCANYSTYHNDKIISSLASAGNGNEYLINEMGFYGDGSLSPQLMNTNVYEKKISAFGYNPFLFSSTDSLMMNHQLFDIASKRKIVTASDTSAMVSVNSVMNNDFIISSKSKNEGEIILSQNNYKYWTASIDNKSTPILSADITLMKVKVPAGNHLIKFKYQSKFLTALYFIMITGFFFILIMLMIMFLRSLNKYKFSGTA